MLRRDFSLAVAGGVPFEDRGVLNEAVDCRRSYGGAGKVLFLLTERLIGVGERRVAFVAGADEFEQNAGFCQLAGDIGEIVE
jgi:hypothetical protein